MWLYRLNRALGPVVGLVDPWFLGMAFPRPIRYLITRQWYERSRAWRAVFGALGTVPVRAEDPRATVDAVCGILARGEVVGVFPEGRISRDGRLQRFRPGLAWIAARSGAPVVPVGIRGSFRSLPRHRRVPRPVRVTVHVGHPLLYPGAPSQGCPAPDESLHFQDAVFREVRRLVGEADPGTGSPVEPVRVGSG